MKRNLLHSRMALIVVAVLSLSAIITSCLDDDYYFEQAKKYYNKQWLKLIGPIPVEHDWSVAQQINATFDLTQEAEGEQLVCIYTHHPLDKNCRLLARTTINGTGEVKFDMLKGHKDVYVRVTNTHQEITFEGYFMLEGTNLAVTPQTIATRLLSRLINDSRVWAENCTIELADAHRDGLNEYRELNGSIDDSVDMMHMHYFENNQHYERVCLNFIDDIYPIIHDANNQTAIFQEQTDNRAKATQGVEYITIGDTEIALTYVFGATGFYNSFGYFYWDPSKGETYQDAHKIILINDARPQNNIRYSLNGETSWDEATTFSRGSGFSDLIVSGDENPYDEVEGSDPITPTHIVGTKYKLVYYGKNYDQEPTYTFPEGTHIGFFIYNNYVKKSDGQYAYDVTDSPLDMSNNDSYHKNLVFSLPEYNADIKEYYNYRILEEKKDTITGMQGIGEISAVTYSYKGHTILGFEDGIDKDMNDILLLVDADVRTDQGVIEDIEEESFIIACEDLGNTGDYDFNDVVFKVSHVGGSNELKVTPLASGGTLPVILKYRINENEIVNICTFKPNGSNTDLDFHNLIDPDANMDKSSYNPFKPLNVRKGETITVGETIIIPVDPDFSINKNDFIVQVRKDHDTSVFIEPGSIYIDENMKDSAHNKAPQMMILPGNWNWPTEGTLILKAYPDFSGWTREEEESAFWYNNRVAEHLVDYTSTEGENGGGTGGGEIGTPPEPDSVLVNIPVTGFNNQQTTLSPQKHATHYNEVIYIPESYFSPQGSVITIVAKPGVNQTVSAGINNTYSLGISDNGTLVGSISANELRNYVVNSTVPLHFWCEAKNIEHIEITTYVAPAIPEGYIIYDDYEYNQKYAAWGNLVNSTTGSASYHEIIDYEGSKVLHYHNDTDLGQGQAYKCEIVYTGLDGKITNGKTYLLSMRIKGSNNGSFSGGFRTTDSQGTGQLDVSVTTEWQTVMIPITCTGDGTVRLLFDLGRYATDLYFDDLKLKELGSTEREILTDDYSGANNKFGTWGNNSVCNRISLLTITNPKNNTTSNFWDAQLRFRPNITFETGKTYQLSAKVRGTVNGNIRAFLQRSSDYKDASERPGFNISNSWQQIKHSFTCYSDVENADLVMFDLGDYTGDLYFEEVILTLPNQESIILNSPNSTYDAWGSDSSPRILSSEAVVKLYNPSPIEKDAQIRYDLSGITANNCYKLEMEVRGDNNGSLQVFMQEFKDEKFNNISETNVINVTNGETQTVTLYFLTIDSDLYGSNYLLFNFNNYTGNIFFDNLRLTILE